MKIKVVLPFLLPLFLSTQAFAQGTKAAVNIPATVTHGSTYTEASRKAWASRAEADEARHEAHVTHQTAAMTKILFFGCAAALLFVAACKIGVDVAPSGAQSATIVTTRDEKAFAQQVFACVKTGNAKDWCALFPAPKEVAGLLRKTAAKKIQGMTPEVADVMTAQQAAEGDGFCASHLQDLRKLAAGAGLNWGKAVYGDFIFEAGPSPAGNCFVNGDVWFKAGKTEWVIEGVEAIEMPDGWRLQNVQMLKKIDHNE